MTVSSWLMIPAAGAVAAFMHLAMTWIRAEVGLKGAIGLAMITLPIAIATPALCLFAALWLSPTFGWLAVVGYWMIRSVMVVCVARL